jgi:hypothetical protein
MLKKKDEELKNTRRLAKEAKARFVPFPSHSPSASSR